MLKFMKKVVKRGRPAKAKPEVVVIKGNTQIKLEKAEATIKDLQQIITGLEELVDVSYKEQEALRKEISMCLNMTISHCVQVERSTGNVSQSDIQYCVQLTERILAQKFDSKSED
jgi:hypothetical protein